MPSRCQPAACYHRPAMGAVCGVAGFWLLPRLSSMSPYRSPVTGLTLPDARRCRSTPGKRKLLTCFGVRHRSRFPAIKIYVRAADRCAFGEFGRTVTNQAKCVITPMTVADAIHERFVLQVDVNLRAQQAGPDSSDSPAHHLRQRGRQQWIATVASRSSKHAPFASLCLKLAPQFTSTSVH
jgi:hypothetical protein